MRDMARKRPVAKHHLLMPSVLSAAVFGHGLFLVRTHSGSWRTPIAGLMGRPFPETDGALLATGVQYTPQPLAETRRLASWHWDR